MTYNVFGGTLNIAQLNSMQSVLLSLTLSLLGPDLFRDYMAVMRTTKWTAFREIRTEMPVLLLSLLPQASLST